MGFLKNLQQIVKQHLNEVPLPETTKCPKCGKDSKWLSAHLILKHDMTVKAAGSVAHAEHRAVNAVANCRRDTKRP